MAYFGIGYQIFKKPYLLTTWGCCLPLVFLVSLIALPSQSHPEQSLAINSPEIQPNRRHSTATEKAITLTERGNELYENGQITAAIALWKEALELWRETEDGLNQAMVLSNLSLAHQGLGQWTAAKGAIEQAASLLSVYPQNTDGNYQRTYAQLLSVEGNLYQRLGDSQKALENWEKATYLYTEFGDISASIQGRLNQAQALQSLGFNQQAIRLLIELKPQLEQQPLNIQIAGWRRLGDGFRKVGDLEQSEHFLQRSLTLAEGSSLQVPIRAQEISATLISLGNTAELQHEWQAAQQFYTRAAETAPTAIARIKARLNLLDILQQVTHPQQSDSVNSQGEIRVLIEHIQSDLAGLPPGQTAIYGRINLVQSLITKRSIQHPPETTLAAILAEAIAQGKILGDQRAISYGLGTLGHLYEQTGQLDTAESLTREALSIAESVNAPDIAYQWQWQLGRLLSSQENHSGAIAAYTTAVETLESIRGDLLMANPDIQYSFRDDVEPVYREMVDLLLRSEGPISQANLRLAIQSIDRLQIRELENFLGCDLNTIAPLGSLTIDPSAAFIYPILLAERMVVILEMPGEDQPLSYYEIPQSRATVEAVIQQLRRDLSDAPDRTPEVLEQAKTVYQWLVKPLDATLVRHQQIDTLVFVLDGSLRNIPMAVLHDDQEYLIAKYAVAVAPRLQLFSPQPLPSNLQVFTGGIGEPQTIGGRAFPEIEYLEAELQGIGKLVKSNTPLLNTNFSLSELQTQLQGDRPSIVHLKTHGVFSSDPQETFIVAYQELIRGRDLGNIIRSGNPIELLILSACSTAQGDNRAVLGLAGTAVQAGARSTVSTLWEAQDLANTRLMLQFYQALSKPGTTRAKALQQAQLALMDEGYRAPHIWAAYILVGNWQ